MRLQHLLSKESMLAWRRHCCREPTGHPPSIYRESIKEMEFFSVVHGGRMADSNHELKWEVLRGNGKKVSNRRTFLQLKVCADSCFWKCLRFDYQCPELLSLNSISTLSWRGVWTTDLTRSLPN